MYKIKLTAKARSQLKNLSKLEKFKIADIFDDLREDPYLGKALSLDLTNRFSYREGVYRIIYQINSVDQMVIIHSADHRSKVYN